jgi:hypothetical protein
MACLIDVLYQHLGAVSLLAVCVPFFCNVQTIFIGSYYIHKYSYLRLYYAHKSFIKKTLKKVILIITQGDECHICTSWLPLNLPQ